MYFRLPLHPPWFRKLQFFRSQKRFRGQDGSSDSWLIWLLLLWIRKNILSEPQISVFWRYVLIHWGSKKAPLRGHKAASCLDKKDSIPLAESADCSRGQASSLSLEAAMVNTCFQQYKKWLYTWTSPDGQYQNQIVIFFAVRNGALYSQQKQDMKLTVAQIMNSLLQNSDLNWTK